MALAALWLGQGDRHQPRAKRLDGVQVGAPGVIQDVANSRDGLAVNAVLQALGRARAYGTDRLGTIELTETDGRSIRVP